MLNQSFEKLKKNFIFLNYCFISGFVEESFCGPIPADDQVSCGNATDDFPSSNGSSCYLDFCAEDSCLQLTPATCDAVPENGKPIA